MRIESRILSPTAINTYLSCPRKFYLRYIKKLRTKPSIHLIRGSIIHATLHQFHTRHPGSSSHIPPDILLEELLGMFNNQWTRSESSIAALGLSKDEIKDYYDDSTRMIRNFCQWFSDNGMPTAVASEARLRSRNLGLMGIIDAVHMTDSKVFLVDYKTSKHARITDDIMRQAALYALLYRDIYAITPEAVWIHFLKEPGKPQPIYIDEALLDYGTILIESVRKKTQSTDESSYPCTCGGYCEKEFIEA